MVNILRYAFLNIQLKQPLKGINIASASVLIARNMASPALASIPKVDIDPSGIFKYILMKIYDEDDNEGSVIVRGYERCEYHADIYDEVQEKIHPISCEPMGGGRISHDPKEKKIHIYGYSQGYGKGDHELAAKLIKEVYPTYKITVSDEGY